MKKFSHHLGQTIPAILWLTVSTFFLVLGPQTSCSGAQLTVDEAEAGLTASCVLLAQAMTKNHPKELDAVVSQVCQPGRTRAFIARVLVKGTGAPTTEYLDFLDDPNASGASKSPAPTANLPPSEPDDAGVRP